MAREFEIVVGADGSSQAIYSDEIAALFESQDMTVRRASHVEPHPTRGGWIADMRPVGGPILGQSSEFTPLSVLPLEYIGAVEMHMLDVQVRPFATRQAALDAEVAWLTTQMRDHALPTE